MIYTISDLHGYPVEKLKQLLKLAGFSGDDYLFILGDVIDRNGDGGIGILQWLMTVTNATLLLGNHEAMLLTCEFVIDEISEETLSNLTREKLEMLSNYIANGGDVTLRELRKLPRETQQDIFDYLKDCPLYETVTAGGKDYILVHAGLDNFRKDRKLSDYSVDELIWTWPELTDEYFDDVHTVFGHTPTRSLDPCCSGKILRTRTWTDIDVGAAYGNEPVLFRLDDGKTFQLK
jgi:serine/threonine protein phosphatase 1